MMVLLVAWAAWAGTCPERSTSLAVASAEAVATSRSQGDAAGVSAHGAELSRLIVCMERGPDAHESAVIHRGMAIVSATAGEVGLATRSFRAARLHEPGWSPPPALAPPGSELMSTWTSTAGARGALAPLPERELVWVIDGAPLGAVAEDRAFVAQLYTERGEVVWSRYAHRVSDVEGAPTRGPKRGGWVGLTLGGLTVSALGGALTAASLASGGAWVSAAGAAETEEAWESAAAGYRRASVGVAMGESVVAAGMIATGAGAVALVSLRH